MVNLRAKMYEMWPRSKIIEIEQKLLILRELGNAYTKRSVEKAVNVLKNPEQKKIMGNFHKTYVKTICELLLGEPSGEFGIVGHGDVKINNFLFQYVDDDVTYDIDTVLNVSFDLNSFFRFYRSNKFNQ